MENIILSGMLKEFATRFDFLTDKPDRQFENFANYCLLKTDHYDSFEFEKVSTGVSLGIDGIAVVISGVIVDEIDDVTDFTKTQFDATFHFTQAKTSGRFDLGSFLKLSSVVKAFFQRDAGALPPELLKAFAIKELVYERSAKMRQLPTVRLHYAYTGEFAVDSGPVLAAVQAEVKSLEGMPYKFSEVTGTIYDGSNLANLYRDTKNDVSKRISFQRHTALPSIKGASAAYIGVVKCSDYVDLLTKDGGDLNKGLFSENVRDFLGDRNVVNSQIALTINTPEERDRFAILNNGVTIVANRVQPSGDRFQISKFQVVNGCQTSHVLYKNRTQLTDDMYITVKLIETTDIDLYGRIIATTNSQTVVTKEAFATIKPYHKTLEDFFDAMRGSGYNFYYERRPHQFDELEHVAQSSIVSAPYLIKSFISVVMEHPDQVHYYYGRLLEEYNRNESSEIFSEADSPGLYFVANLIVAKTRSALGKHSALYHWLFHIALLIKKQVAPELNKGKHIRDKEFLQLLGRIEDSFPDAFAHAVQTLERARLRLDDNRLPEKTAALLKNLTSVPPTRVRPSPESGTRFKLGNGFYVGTVTKVDEQTFSATIQYGPFVVSANFLPSLKELVRSGAKARFSVSNSDIRMLDIL